MFAQFDFPKLSLAGGPILNYNYANVDDINNEMRKIGFGDFPTSGFFSVGGGGFIDLPILIKSVRFSGYGYGYKAQQIKEYTDIVKSVTYSYNEGGFGIEYVKKPSAKTDLTFGSSFGFGSMNIQLNQFSKSLKNWNIVGFGGDTLSSTANGIYNYSKFQFSMMPKVGFGYRILPYAYLKLDAGYLFTVSGKWKLNDLLEVQNIPDGIKADGFKLNLGLYIGFFAD